ncbi:MAG TPA: GNAT family N-acetyltransferase [Angustibacter sp.]|nr:GNAT family N-acetyltransferase [Angustibacter sp.]
MTLEPAALLARYDEQERSGTHARDGETTERVGGVLRTVYAADQGFVTALGLDETTADAAIRDQVAFFSALDDGRGRRFEWKVYGHDRPGDLGDRLAAAGFEPEDVEALVIGSTDDVLRATEGTELPAGARMREVTDDTLEDDARRIADLHTEVWGEPIARYAERLVHDKRADPRGVRLYVVETDDEQRRTLSAARLEMRPGAEPGAAPLSDFAGLWGGATVADWRGRGIYRSLVRLRARHAAEAGVPYLQVDASPDSRPILERLGLVQVDWTRPYVWSPPS